MEVIVRYSDFSETIKEVTIPVDQDKRNVIRIDGDQVQLESVDESVSFSVTQNMAKSELRDYVQLLQKILNQMK